MFTDPWVFNPIDLSANNNIESFLALNNTLSEFITICLP
jgi:hypothetical protein